MINCYPFDSLLFLHFENGLCGMCEEYRNAVGNRQFIFVHVHHVENDKHPKFEKKNV